MGTTPFTPSPDESSDALVHGGIDRLALIADAKLVAELAQRNFQGIAFEAFEHAVASYGMSVLAAWISSGQIFSETAKMGRPVRVSDQDRAFLRQSDHERDILIGLTVAPALRRFTNDGLRAGGWDPSGGATLATYFVQTMKQEFANAFRSWKREQLVYEGLVESDGRFLPVSDPVYVAELRQIIRELDLLEEPLASCVWYSYMGYSHKEISALLAPTYNLTPAAVQKRLIRFLRKNGFGAL